MCECLLSCNKLVLSNSNRNYQLNEFKWNWISILMVFVPDYCSFKAAINFNHWPSTMNKRRVFALFLGAMSFCSSFNSMYNPIVRISEMKGNENNEISEKQCKLFCLFLFKKFFSRSIFNSVCNEKVRRLLEYNFSKMWKLRSRNGSFCVLKMRK